jgi:ABC-2 type transport system permease protein
MISALLYLQIHSVKNRLLMRLKRLKQPKYLVGGIVGGLYFYFYFFRYLFGFSGRSQAAMVSPFTIAPENAALIEAAGAMLLLVMVLLQWVLPYERASLAFSEAEAAFLFPAPISRRGLIHFKLVRSQVAILFTALILMLVTSRFGGSFWIHAAGWWVVLSTLNLHSLGASFARTRLLDRGITNWQRRLGILGLVLLVIAGAAVWARQTLPTFDVAQLGDLDKIKAYAGQLLTAGPVPYVLYPFRLVVRPYLATDAAAFGWAAAPALLLLALHYVWVIRANVAFEEASVEASRKLAEKIASIRAGNWQTVNRQLKGKRPPFTLRPIGPPATALLWKNLISAGQAFTVRMWVMLAGLGVGLCFAFGQGGASVGIASVVGMGAGMLAVWSLLIGPQLLRQDFRQDLAVADVLKMYPLQGWQVALGEVLGPALILTGIQWVLLLLACTLIWQAPIPGLGRANCLAIGFGAAVLVPMLNLITLQIPNAAVLLFPAWFQPGKEGPHGIEATGQRIIFMIGQVLVFLIALIPATIVFGVIFFIFRLALSLSLVIPLASIAAALVLGAEGAFGVLLLGRLFERFDVAAEAGG